MSLTLGFVEQEPYSEGMKRFTPAAMAASMRTAWLAIAAEPTVETRASMSLSAAVNDSTDAKSTSTTLTLVSYTPGFLERVRTVT